MRIFIYSIILAACFCSGMYIMYRWNKTVDHSESNADVVLERIRQVNKIIVKEGYFTELYDYKDYTTFNLPWFRKKALVRIKAKASVGYDLEKMEISSDEQTKTITIKKIPALELLSLDHDLDYYDITEGSFNNFEVEDYNKINSNAKNYIKAKVYESDLMKPGEFSNNLFFQQLRFVVESAGWKIRSSQPNTISILDTLKK